MLKLLSFNLLFVFCFTGLFPLSDAALTYNVLSYGARGDGQTDSTQAFVRAWSSACSSRSSAIVYVPWGTFLIKPIAFNGPCKSQIVFRIAGKIVAPWDYWTLGSAGYWILFYKVNNLHISGGTFDARGSAFWYCRQSGKSCPPGVMSISFTVCNNVAVSGLTSLNSQLFHIAVDQCNNIVFHNTKINAPSWSLNTDGIHVQSSTFVTIFRGNIQTGDDCISIGPGSKHIWVERIACGPGHGISVGSLAESTYEDGVQNITVTGCILTRTENGVRIKTWARPSIGFARNINFRNIIVKKVYNPIIIDQNYCPSNKNCPNQSSGVKIRGVNFSNIRGTSASQVIMNFVCSPSNPCQGIHVQDIRLSYVNGYAKSYCKNAAGSHSGVVVPYSCL
ncbi:hypothetical protein SLE2022_073240 [Rubroshorea leprosula]